MTTQSILLSIALQSGSQEYLLLFLFLIVAVIFFAIFYYWWRGVSDEDLEALKKADANQTTGPAITGEKMPEYAQAEADAIADRDVLLAEEADHMAAEAAEEVETAVAEPVEDAAETETEPVAVVEAEPISAAPDDLKKIEGIGPKIQELLNNAGIFTFAQLADAEVEQLKQILADAGTRYQLADPSSWPTQAKLAAAADWDGLNELQDKLSVGKHAD